MFLRLIALSLLAFFASVGSLPACSVPVFRYALERWSPDLFEVSVFFRGTLNDTDAKRLTQLEDWAVHNGGNVNLEVVRCDLDERVPADLLDLWKSLKDAPLPTVVVRTPLKATGQHIFWQGRLSDPFLEDLATSPARREVAQRLLRGDAVVWLLLRGSDKELAARTRASLDAALAKLAEEIELPPGVGRPGSELLAKIPLQMKFSVVEVSAESAEEQTLIKLLHGGLAKAPVASDSYIAPVFGRGRVLNVLSASKLESETVGDWTRYLCSACSCQVKQQNPGFDLLCAMNWEGQLFHENSLKATDESTTDTELSLVSIPSGQTVLDSNSTSTAPSLSSAGTHFGVLLAMAALAVVASLIVIVK